MPFTNPEPEESKALLQRVKNIAEAIELAGVIWCRHYPGIISMEQKL